MKSLIVIGSLSYKSVRIEVSKDGEPEKVWENIILVTKHIINNTNTMFTCITFVNELLKFDNYVETQEMNINSADYIIFITLFKDNINCRAFNENKVECFRKTYLLQPQTDGNCIDDFIKRGIEPLLSDISDLKDSIKSRKDDRIQLIEYHKSQCYEQDFSQINMIKQLAEKIVNNCNIHLERITEFYTNLH